MKKGRSTEEQIIGILKQHEAGVKTADVCREHGISAATFSIFRSAFCSAKSRTLHVFSRITSAVASPAASV